MSAIGQQDYERAVTVLMEAYGTEIYRFCLSRLGSKQHAEDALQIVFVQAFEKLSTFRGDASLRTWLYTVARNRCRDETKMEERRQRRIVFTDQTPETPTDRGVGNDPILERTLKQCLGKLGGDARDAVLLRLREGFSFTELASMLGVKPGTVQARVARALPQLRSCMQSHGVEL